MRRFLLTGFLITAIIATLMVTFINMLPHILELDFVQERMKKMLPHKWDGVLTFEDLQAIDGGILIKDVKISNNTSCSMPYFAMIPRIELRWNFKPLLLFDPIIFEVTVCSPKIMVEKTKEGEWSFLALPWVGQAGEQDTEKSWQTVFIPFLLKEVLIKNLGIESKTPAFSSRISGIDITIENFYPAKKNILDGTRALISAKNKKLVFNFPGPKDNSKFVLQANFSTAIRGRDHIVSIHSKFNTCSKSLEVSNNLSRVSSCCSILFDGELNAVDRVILIRRLRTKMPSGFVNLCGQIWLDGRGQVPWKISRTQLQIDLGRLAADLKRICFLFPEEFREVVNMVEVQGKFFMKIRGLEFVDLAAKSLGGEITLSNVHMCYSKVVQVKGLSLSTCYMERKGGSPEHGILGKISFKYLMVKHVDIREGVIDFDVGLSNWLKPVVITIRQARANLLGGSLYGQAKLQNIDFEPHMSARVKLADISAVTIGESFPDVKRSITNGVFNLDIPFELERKEESFYFELFPTIDGKNIECGYPFPAQASIKSCIFGKYKINERRLHIYNTSFHIPDLLQINKITADLEDIFQQGRVTFSVNTGTSQIGKVFPHFDVLRKDVFEGRVVALKSALEWDLGKSFIKVSQADVSISGLFQIYSRQAFYRFDNGSFVLHVRSPLKVNQALFETIPGFPVWFPVLLTNGNLDICAEFSGAFPFQQGKFYDIPLTCQGRVLFENVSLMAFDESWDISNLGGKVELYISPELKSMSLKSRAGTINVKALPFPLKNISCEMLAETHEWMPFKIKKIYVTIPDKHLTIAAAGSTKQKGVQLKFEISCGSEEGVSWGRLSFVGKSFFTGTMNVVPDDINVQGKVQFDLALVSLEKLLSAKHMRGCIPFSWKKPVPPKPRDDITQWAYPTLNDTSPYNVTVENVCFKNIEANELSGLFMLKQNNIACRKAHVNILGGDLIASGDITLLPKEKYSLRVEATNMDVSLLGSGKSISQKGSIINFVSWLSGVGTDVTGEFHITKIGKRALQEILRYIDPGGTNKSVQRIRKQIAHFSMYPERVDAEVLNSLANITVRLVPESSSILGLVTVEDIKIYRIPVGRILKIIKTQ